MPGLIVRLIATLALLHASVQPALAHLSSIGMRSAMRDANGAAGMRGGRVGSLPATAVKPALDSSFPDFYARGDANCSLDLTAADVVAHVLGVGAPVCGNDDCDRDGVVTAADAACGARCLFGECPLLPGAPEISEVAPETSDDIVPLSLIRIRGHDLSAADQMLQVQIDGEDAGIVEATDEEIVVAVPVLDPGAADLVVFNGEKASRRMPLTIASPSPIGETDGLGDLLGILDDALTRFASLDLGELYDADTSALLLAAIADFRAKMDTFRLDGLAPLPPEVRALLDGFVDGGGVVDAMRTLLDEVQGGASQGGAAGPVETILGTRQVVTQIYVATIELTKKYSAAKLAALEQAALENAGARLLGARLAAGVLAASGAALVYLLLNAPEILRDATVPIPVGVRFLDRDLEEREFPTAGGRIRFRGCRIGRLATGLRVKLSNGATVPLAATSACGDTEGIELCPANPIPPFENGCVEYQLPDTVGFCGLVGFELFNDLVVVDFTAPEYRLFVQPELLSVQVEYPRVVNRLRLDVRGVAPCQPEVFVDGPAPSERGRKIGFTSALVLPSDPTTVAATPDTAKSVSGGCSSGEVPPGRYQVSVAVGDGISKEPVAIDLESRVLALKASCDAPVLATSSGQFPLFGNCSFTALGKTLAGAPLERLCFPVDTERIVATLEGGAAVFESELATSQDLTLVRRDALGPEKFTTRVRGLRPGISTLRGMALLEGDTVLAETDPGFEIEVRDVAEPAILSVSPCGGMVNAGDVLRLGVDTLDDVLMSRITVSVPEGTSAEPNQDFPCILDLSEDVCPPFIDCDTCSHDFDIPLEADLAAGPLTVAIEAIDGAGNTTSQQCTYDVKGVDRTPPDVTVSPCGGTVRAGEMLQIRVEATDQGAIERLVLSVPGELATNPTQESQCDAATCVRTFDVDLRDPLRTDDVTIDIEAFDADGNAGREQCVFDVEGAPDLTVEPCGGTVQPGATIRVRVEALGDGTMERLRATVPASVSFDPVQEVDCQFRSCNGNFEIPVREPLAVEDFNLLVEAFDVAGNRADELCPYTVVRPASVTFQRIVDSETQVPGLDTNFGNFLDWAISGARVAFAARFRPAFNDAWGIYVWDGSKIVMLADGNTIVPGTGGSRRFRSYSQVSMSGTEVTFKVSDSDFRDDLFRTRIGADPVNGVERVIAFSQLDPVPITGFMQRNGFVAGWFSPGGDSAIYLAPLPSDPHGIEFIADENTNIPMGTGKFTGLASPGALDVDSTGPIVAFRGLGENNQEGIYVRRRGGPIERVADTTVVVPEGRGKFSAFCGEAVDGTDVAFRGDDTVAVGREGVYLRRSGVLEKIVDGRTDVPGSDGTFEELTCSVGLDAGIVTFKSDKPDGVFAHAGGALTRVVAVSDPFDGGVVTGTLSRGEDGIDGNRVAVLIQVQHGSEFPVPGLYIATVESQP